MDRYCARNGHLRGASGAGGEPARLEFDARVLETVGHGRAILEKMRG